MATTGFSASNYHSVADHADFTLPNGDWAELLILRPDTVTGTFVPLSNGAGYSANTRQIYQFDNSLELVVNGTDGTLASGLSASTWYLVCAQRNAGNMSIRFVPMGSTTVTAGSNVALSAASNSTSSTFIGRANDGTANAFNGAISDWLYVPGQTISDADLQSIATGTAIDSFSWYSSAVFWAIFENQTNTDHIGSKTVTENGTLTSESDPAQLVRFGAVTVTIGQAAETNTAQLVFGNNQAAQYSSGNYHHIADAAGMTLPNNDWTWLLTVKTGSDITTAQDVIINGVYQAANVLDVYIQSSTFNLDISNLGTDESVSCVASTWYVMAITRSSGTFTLRVIPFGSGTVSESTGTAISSAYDSSSGYHFGHDEAGSFPLLGGAIGDALFLPGEAVSDADLISIAQDNDPLEDFAWFSSREFHLIASKAEDNTGNHTVSTTGSPLVVPGPPGFIRFTLTITVEAGQAAETNTSQTFDWSKILGIVQSSETDAAQTITVLKLYNLGQSTEADAASEFIADTSTKLLLQSQENDSADAFDKAKLLSINQTSETDSADTFTPEHVVNLLQSSETDTSTAFTFFKILSIGSSAETDAAVAVIRIGGTLPPLTMDNEGVKIIARDLIENASVTATSTASGFSADNIKNDEKFEIWRSTDLSTQQITFTWGSAQVLSALAIIFSNLIEGSTVNVEVFTNAADSEGFAHTGAVPIDFAYQPPKGFNSIGYLSFAYGGGTYYSTFFEEQTVEKIRVTLTSAGNPDGYMEISRIVAGLAADFVSGANYGASVTKVDASEHNRSYTGDAVVNRRGQHKVMDVTLGKLTPEDRAANSNMIRGISNDSLVFVSVSPDAVSDFDKQLFQIYGAFADQNNIVSIAHNRSSSTFNIEEF